MKPKSKGLSTFPKNPLKKNQHSINKFVGSLKSAKKPISSVALISSLLKKKIRSMNISKEKIKEFKIISAKKNPFTYKNKKLSKQKKRIISKPLNSKGQQVKINFINFNKTNDFWEKNYLNEDLSERDNMTPTIETETNGYINNKEFDYDELFNAFKNSELKTTIIMDNCGNSNLNCEQKKIIENYFYKKKELEKNIKKCNINTIKVEKYHCNDIHMKQNKSQMVNLNNKNFSNSKINNFNLNKKKIRMPFIEKGNRFIPGKKILSTKENLLIRDLFEIKDEKNKENIYIINSDDESEENNSIFENFQKKSDDSSFIDSSEGEDLILAFKENDLKY